ncbi:hypothetical protein [Mycoplasmopsis columbinasalis]|uniref:Uncharacterized protein n=1 Tax=Mycoplasmopsis columbinasalis TaxID=114880 RepID=A0A449B9I5_9BACT|nr:hypothetical protein [Mycoplasmopsis columbinasalis]VEU77824.1 Uncharacterised protein [Mycoplasmopsis columbinasalis]
MNTNTQTVTNLQTQYNFALPILKPLEVKADFCAKVFGAQTDKKSIVLIAEEENDVFFLACVNAINASETAQKHIVQVQTDLGLSENGELTKIETIAGVDLDTIYRINYFDLRSQLQTDDLIITKLPFLGLKNQLEIVQQLSERLRGEEAKLPRLVIIKRKAQSKNQ